MCVCVCVCVCVYGWGDSTATPEDTNTLCAVGKWNCFTFLLCSATVDEIFECSVLMFGLLGFLDVLFDEMCLCEIMVFEIFEYSVFGPRFH